MRIGIVGAMLEEISLLSEGMTNASYETFGCRNYFSGKLHGIDTVLVFSRWGKVAASMAAMTLITKYHINCLIFVGVAGAIENKLNIGDVVIANNLYQHDMDARPLFKKYEIPLTNKILFATDNHLSSLAENAVKIFYAHGIKKAIAADILQEFSIENPALYIGTIASGDSFVGNNVQKEAIQKDMPDTLAVEMEGAAVAQVCSEHNIPFTIIRTISDKADHSANIDFNKFISQVAKYYAKNIIETMYQSMALKKS